MSVSALSVCALWPSQYTRYETLDGSVNQGYAPPFHLFDLPTPLDLLDPLHLLDLPTPFGLLHPLHLLDLFDLPPIAPSLPPLISDSGHIGSYPRYCLVFFISLD